MRTSPKRDFRAASTFNAARSHRRKARKLELRQHMTITAKDIREFNAYLQQCTDRQVQGVYDKEKAAGRDEYVALAEAEAQRRGIILERQ
jgi:hypothetical protein